MRKTKKTKKIKKVEKVEVIQVVTRSTSLTVSDGEYSVRIKIDQEKGKISISPSNGNGSFIFTDENSNDTVKRWVKIGRLLTTAAMVLGTERENL